MRAVQLLTHQPETEAVEQPDHDLQEAEEAQLMSHEDPEEEPQHSFTFEALRSRIVCPGKGAPEGAVLIVPQLLLQLPPEGAPLHVEHHAVQARL